MNIEPATQSESPQLGEVTGTGGSEAFGGQAYEPGTGGSVGVDGSGSHGTSTGKL